MLQGRGEATAGRMAVLGMVAGYMPRGSNPGHSIGFPNTARSDSWCESQTAEKKLNLGMILPKASFLSPSEIVTAGER